MNALQSFVPPTVPGARRALAAMQRDMDAERTYAAIRKIERTADAIRVLFADVEEVRRQAVMTIQLARHRIAKELQKAPKAKGTRGQLVGPGVIGGTGKRPP